MINLCNICNKKKATIQCRYCKKWICNKCYGNLNEVRKCCKQEEAEIK